jgi:tape measure domain-containing protein
MPQDETIKLGYDVSGVEAAAGKANRAIESNEKTFERAGQAAVKATEVQAAQLVRLTERSRASINRTVEQAQRRAAAVQGETAVQRVQQERARDIRRVQGDPAALVKVSEAYRQIEEAAARADRAARLEESAKGMERARAAARTLEDSIAGANRELDIAKRRRDEEVQRKLEESTRRAAAAIREKLAAVEKSNAAAARSKAIIEEEIRALERRAAAAGKSPVARLQEERSGALQRAAGNQAEVDRVTAAYGRLIAAQRAADNAALLDKAQVASRRAAAGAREFEKALVANQRALELERAAVEKSVRSLETRAVEAQKATGILTKEAAARRNIAAITEERRDFLANFKGNTTQIERAKLAFDRLIEAERKAEREAASLEKRFRSMGESLSTVGRAMTFAITIPMAAAAGAAVFLYGKLELARIGFTTMLGSAERAGQFLRELAAFALTTPFEFRELIPMAQRLRAFGFQAREVIPILGAVGSAVAALGGGADLIDRITLALGQMQAKGKVSHEEVRQLAEAGIPVWDVLSKKIGVSVPEAMKLAEKGAIRASVAIPAILTDMTQRFGGLLEKQNQTTIGQFSNLKDRLGFLAMDVGRVLDPVAASLIKFAASTIGFLQQLVTQFSLLPQPVQTATIAIVGLIAVAGPAAAALGALSRALAFLYGAQFAGAVTNLLSLGSGVRGLAAMAGGAIGPLTLMETRLLLLGKAAAVVGAAFAGWYLGKALDQLLGFNRHIDDAVASANKLKRAGDEMTKFAANKLFESLKARGVVIKQSGQSLEAWTIQLRQAAEQLSVFDDIARRNANQPDAGALERATAAEKRALEFRDGAVRRELEGMAAVEERRRQALREFGITTRARVLIEEAAAALRLKVIEDAEKKAQSFRDSATARELTGLERVQEQRRQAIAELDRQGLTPAQRVKALGLIDEGTQALTQKYYDGLLKQAEDFYDTSARVSAEGFDRTAQLRDEYLEKVKDNAAAVEVVNRAILIREKRLTDDLALELQRRVRERELASLDAGRDTQLRGVQALEAQILRLGDGFANQAVAQKIELEQRKSAIEQEYLLKRAEIESDILNKRAFREAELAQTAAQKNAILDRARQDSLDIEERAIQKIQEVREQSSIRTMEIIRDEQQRVFDAIQRQAENLFDSMLQGAKSFGDALKRIMLSALLTPVKQAFSTAVASILTGAQTGAPSFGGAAGRGGLLGRVFGGAALASSLAIGAPGAPGGTPGFAGPVSSISVAAPAIAGAPGGTPGIAGPVGGLSTASRFGLGVNAAGLKQFLGFGSSSIATGAGRATTTATLGGKLTALGKSDAALGAGIALGADGLRRGGALGLAETTAGGALIGFRFGGPVGAAIGAAVGFAAGTIRLFIKGAQEKIVEKVKKVYGITITKGFARDPLLGIIKQQFGGNIDLGIRSKQVRDLIELYAMSTGQERGGALAPQVQASRFTQSGGAFTAAATYSNGQLVGSAAPIGAAPQVVVRSVQLVVNGQAATDALEGRIAPVVSRSPEAVAKAQATATRLSIRRRQAAADTLAPGVLVS